MSISIDNAFSASYLTLEKLNYTSDRNELRTSDTVTSVYE